jgi:hypothetical protein
MQTNHISPRRGALLVETMRIRICPPHPVGVYCDVHVADNDAGVLVMQTPDYSDVHESYN